MKPNLRFFALFCFASLIAAPAFAQSDGANIFKANCQVCHGPDGLGRNPVGQALKIVSLKDPSVVKSSNAELAATINKGKNKMPSFATKLSDTQIKAVIEFIRTLEK